MDADSKSMDREEGVDLMLMFVKENLIDHLTKFHTGFEIIQEVKLDINPFTEGEVLDDGRIALTLNPEVEKRFTDYYDLIKEEAERKYGVN